MAMIFGQNRLGTADYISPEQYIDSYQIDERADIYSLGCAFYFALTGKVPFPYKSSAQKLKAHLKKRPISVRELRPEIPKRVELIVSKMMAKRRENRLQTATEIVRHLEPFADRRSMSINFRSVLNARTTYANKRQAGQPAKAGPASTHHIEVTPSAKSGKVDPPPSTTRQSTIETIVNEETRVGQPRRSEAE